MHKTPQSFHKFFLLYLSLTFISTPTYTAESQASEECDKCVLAATHRGIGDPSPKKPAQDDGGNIISHLSFGVSDLNRSVAFYDATLAPLGIVRVWTVPDAVGYGFPGGNDKLALKAQPEQVIPPGSGFHLAFTAASHEAVDAFYAAALMAGGSDNGSPGFRLRYSPTYYAAFVIDPDGYRLEAVCQ